PDLCLRGVVGQCLGTDKPAPASLQPYLNAFPLPNGPENGTTGKAQFVAAFSTPGKLHATSVRIDHAVNSKFTGFGRYSDSPSETSTRNTGNLAWVLTTRVRVKTLTVGTTNLFTSRLTNEFRFNFTWNDSQLPTHLDNFGGAVPFDLGGVRDVNGQATPGLDVFLVSLTFGGTSICYLQDVRV